MRTFPKKQKTRIDDIFDPEPLVASPLDPRRWLSPWGWFWVMILIVNVIGLGICISINIDKHRASAEAARRADIEAKEYPIAHTVEEVKNTHTKEKKK